MGSRIHFFFALLLMVMVFHALPARGPRHDFHVSITEINHNLETHALEITLKIFTDDIERSVLALGGGDLRLGDARELPTAETILQAYLQHRFTLSVNGQAVKYTWIGKEVELDALWCYLEVPDILQAHQIEVTSRILTELFEDQANVVHFTVNGETQSLYLSKTSLSGQFNF